MLSDIVTPTPADGAKAMANPTYSTSTTLFSSALSRISHLRPAAVSHARRAVKALAKTAGKWFSASEREYLEQMEKHRFYWRSSEPVLMAEAAKWASINPGALPEIPPLEAAEKLPVTRKPKLPSVEVTASLTNSQPTTQIASQSGDQTVNQSGWKQMPEDEPDPLPD